MYAMMKVENNHEEWELNATYLPLVCADDANILNEYINIITNNRRCITD